MVAIFIIAGQEENKPHAGLDIIKERISYLNGTISIDSRPGIGTTVMIAFCADNKTEV